MRNLTKTFIALSIIPQVILVRLLVSHPNWVESLYSEGLYVGISKLMRYLFGWLPFSVGDLLYTIFVIYIIRWLIIHRKKLRKYPLAWCRDVLAGISITYFLFHFLWAFNYYRIPLHTKLKLNKDYTSEQLIDLTQRLIEKSNSIHSEIDSNDTIRVQMPFNKDELFEMVPTGYKALAREYPNLSYSPPSLKKSIYSLPLTYMGFAGYLNPFTNEAQIDGLIPLFRYPTTASHEIAHQLGYAAENEANFIGGLAAMHHPNTYFKYSGYTFALGHCLNEIYVRDPLLYEALSGTINRGILKNYQEMYLFWMSYQNPAEPYFKTTYSNYLKANNQEMGMKSYSYVVALLVNYFEGNPL